MTWTRSDSRNALFGAVALVGLTLLAAPFMPSLRRYVRMLRM